MLVVLKMPVRDPPDIETDSEDEGVMELLEGEELPLLEGKARVLPGAEVELAEVE